MSNAAQTWAWKQHPGKASDKSVLVALADNAWEDGSNAWPSLSTLAAKTDLTSRTVYAALLRLMLAGYIQRDDTPRQHKPAVYRLLYNRAEDAPRAEAGSGVNEIQGRTSQPPERKLTASRAEAASPELDLEPKTNPYCAPAPKPRRATSIPTDWQPTSEQVAWLTAKCPSVRGQSETQQWQDWHLAKGDVAKDWNASWRTWMRKSQGYAATGPANSTSTSSNLPNHHDPDRCPEHVGQWARTCGPCRADTLSGQEAS